MFTNFAHSNVSISNAAQVSIFLNDGLTASSDPNFVHGWNVWNRISSNQSYPWFDGRPFSKEKNCF